jgi:hypothetical protein
VMVHRRKVIDLYKAQNAALQEARTKGADREKMRQVEQTAQMTKLNETWKVENTTLAKKYPSWFAPVEGDTEGNALLEKGFSEVDKMFNPNGATPEQMVPIHAKIRCKSAGFDRMALANVRLSKELATLKKQLSQYESSEPPVGKGSKGAPRTKASFLDEVNADIDEAERKSKA